MRKLHFKKYERPIPPDSPDWKGIPQKAAYVKEWVWKLQMGPCGDSNFIRKYLSAMTPEIVQELQIIYDILERTGHGEMLYRWVNESKINDLTKGKHTVFTLFAILGTLEDLGKLKTKKIKRAKSNPKQPFPDYFVAAADEFWDYTHRGKSVRLLSTAQRKKLLALAIRTKKDEKKIWAFVKRKPATQRDVLFRLMEFLEEAGFNDEVEE